MATLSPRLKQATGVKAVRGEGCYLYDAAGERYLDFTSGIGVVSTGHCHPRVVEAAQRQAGELIHGQYTTVLHPRVVELGERLGEVLPSGLDSLFFASAGTESIEAAVRLARHATGRQNVVVFQGSFHGRTMGSLAMTTSKAAYRAGLQPLMSGVAVAPFPYGLRLGMSEEAAVDFCLARLDDVLESQSSPAETAAMVIEPVLGEGGYVPAPARFLEGVDERCREIGAVLIIDEVQTGFGRTGEFWAVDATSVVPDVLVTAKGLASGFPLSAFAAPAELMAKAWPGSQGGTYGANAVSCAAAIATLDVIVAEGLVANAAEQGALLSRLLGEVACGSDGLIAEVRGPGLMVATEFAGAAPAETAAAVIAECEQRGLLLLPCGPSGSVVRWIPPLVVTGEQITGGVEIFAAAVDVVAARRSVA